MFTVKPCAEDCMEAHKVPVALCYVNLGTSCAAKWCTLRHSITIQPLPKGNGFMVYSV